MTIGRRFIELARRRGAVPGPWSLAPAGDHPGASDWRETIPGWRGRRSYRPAYVAGSLFFIGYPLVAIVHENRPGWEIGLGLVGWALFVATLFYGRRGPAPWSAPRALRVLGVAAIAAIGVVLVLVDRSAEFSVLFYYAGVASIRLAPDRVALTALGSIAVVSGLAVAYATGDIGSGATTGFSVGLISLTVFSLAALSRAYADLHAARQELATLAVAEERNRIARDLHDTLGHSLAVIALKTDLAARLLPADASFDRVRGELGDAQNVARDALHSVRETIGGYRQPTLEGELAGARVALEAAGIAVQVRIEGRAGKGGAHSSPEDGAGRAMSGAIVPQPAESILAWTVREGTTNILRHGQARHAWIAVESVDGWGTAEVSNDGPAEGAQTAAGTASGPHTGVRALDPPGSPARLGTGINGLRERLTALGGTCEAAPRPDGGFRLRVRVPLTISGASRD